MAQNTPLPVSEHEIDSSEVHLGANAWSSATSMLLCYTDTKVLLRPSCAFQAIIVWGDKEMSSIFIRSPCAVEGEVGLMFADTTINSPGSWIHVTLELAGPRRGSCSRKMCTCCRALLADAA
jgi:hypothetical protein